jgi:lipopolysaccharide transport system ATP-binding protein
MSSDSSDIAIHVAGLGKRYRIGTAGTRTNTLRDALMRPLAWLDRPSGSARDLWALREVSFDVPRGQVLGVIGRNGAGKSTLLKLLSRITAPTEGRATLHGRVASLLEVGVGFHPELSGRENIFINGAILGMSRAETVRRFDEIVAFSEVESFIETPVKHYSTGMYIRLAFAVAAHLEPEILLVDEVLAVGDAGFQKKCLGKMRDVGQSGRTVLFVSHNLAALTGLCDRAILIDGGRLVAEGSAHEMAQAYLASFGREAALAIDARTDRIGDGRLRVNNVRLADGAGRPCASLRSGEPGQIILKYSCRPGAHLRNVLVNLYMLSPWGERLCDFQTDLAGENFDEIPVEGEFICTIPKVPLQPGQYPFTFRVYSNERFDVDIVLHAGQIDVDAGDFFGLGRVPERGVMFVDHAWRCRPSGEALEAAARPFAVRA